MTHLMTYIQNKMSPKKTRKNWFVRIFLTGILSFSPIFVNKNVRAGVFSNKKLRTFTFEDGRAIEIRGGTSALPDYKITKTFKLSEGRELQLISDVSKEEVKHSIVGKSAEKAVRIGYDIHGTSPKPHMNIAIKREGLLDKIRDPATGSAHLESGDFSKIAKEKLSESRYFPETPDLLKSRKYFAEIEVKSGSELHYKSPSSQSFKFVNEGYKKLPIDPSKRVRNTVRIVGSNSDDVARAAEKVAVSYSDDAAKLAVNNLDDVARAAEKVAINYSDDAAKVVSRTVARGATRQIDKEGLVGLAGVSLSDGPEFGPVDALLSLWLLYDIVDTVSEFTRPDNNIDYDEHNRNLKIRYPELFEDSPIDISPVTGGIIIKNPVEYYSNFPEPYRTYMYNVMKNNYKQWGVSSEKLEEKFGKH